MLGVRKLRPGRAERTVVAERVLERQVRERETRAVGACLHERRRGARRRRRRRQLRVDGVQPPHGRGRATVDAARDGVCEACHVPLHGTGGRRFAPSRSVRGSAAASSVARTPHLKQRLRLPRRRREAGERLAREGELDGAKGDGAVRALVHGDRARPQAHADERLGVRDHKGRLRRLCGERRGRASACAGCAEKEAPLHACSAGPRLETGATCKMGAMPPSVYGDSLLMQLVVHSRCCLARPVRTRVQRGKRPRTGLATRPRDETQAQGSRRR